MSFYFSGCGEHPSLLSFPTRRSSDLPGSGRVAGRLRAKAAATAGGRPRTAPRSEEHTSELQSRGHLVCRLLLEKKKKTVLEQKDRKSEMTDRDSMKSFKLKRGHSKQI